MSKIVTDNSKVNYNLIEENRKLKLRVEELEKQSRLTYVVSSFLSKQAIERDLHVDDLFIRYDSESNEIDLLHEHDYNRFNLLESYK